MTRLEGLVIARAAKAAKHGSVENRFWSKVEKSDGCWMWTAAVRRRDEGYGAFWLNGRHHYANRVSWELKNGKVPYGFVVCHKCDNPRCVNPDHLFLGTALENNQDKVSKGRQARGDSNGASKLTEKQVIEIRATYQRYKVGHTALIAKAYGITEAYVRDIIRRESWKHL